jgi:hypothetical protein
MRELLFVLACTGIAAGPAGSVYQPAYCMDDVLRAPAADYVPQPGDVIFFNYDEGWFWKLGFKLALSGPPDHAGIIVRLPDGSLAVFESGPDDGLLVEVSCLVERLKFHACNRGPVWVRRRICPLTEDQIVRLGEFAISERGKSYAYWRLLGQTTLLRSRGPLRTHWAGKPKGPKDSYFCSELVLEALVYAGALDPATTRPRATYPEDFFFDRSRNAYLNGRFTLAHSWHPPQRLVFDDCPPCKAYKGSHRNPNPAAAPVHPYFLSR